MNCVFYIFDPGFDANQSMKYRLGLFIHSKGFSLACMDENTTMVIGLADYLAEVPLTGSGKNSSQLFYNRLKETFATIDLFKLPFHEIRVAYSGLVHSLVPDMLVVEDMAEKLLSFNYELDPEAVILKDKIETMDANNIFAISKGLTELLDTLKGDCVIRSASSIFIENILSIPITRNSTTPFYLNFSGNIIDIAWVNKSMVEYCNSFYVHSPEDILYYVIFVTEQLGFDTDSVELMLSGNIAKESDEVILLQKYFSQISFTGRPENIIYSPVLGQEEEQRNFILYNLLS